MITALEVEKVVQARLAYEKLKEIYALEKKKARFPYLLADLTPISHQHSSRFGQTVFPAVEETEEGRVTLTLPSHLQNL